MFGLPAEERIEHLTVGGTSVTARVIDGGGPPIIFLSGYGSDMTGTKATWLSEQCAIWSYRFIRFDYRGRGESPAPLPVNHLSNHVEDCLAVLDQLTDQPAIIVGSSMGGWLGMRLLQLRPEKIAAFIGIAAAPDFTTYLRPQDYAEVPQEFISDAENHIIFNAPLAYNGPVELLQGSLDTEVPPAIAQKILEYVTSSAIKLHLVKDGDHSLSRPEDLQLLWQCLTRIRDAMLPTETLDENGGLPLNEEGEDPFAELVKNLPPLNL